MMDAIEERTGSGQARCIVVGNEKGGSGKSTTSIHLIFSLVNDGYRVVCVDLDFRQRSLSRFLECRAAQAEQLERDLPTPSLRRFAPSALGSVATARGAELSRFDTFMKGLQGPDVDFIVIDTPGNDTVLSAHAHSHADVLVTPLNDSFIDLDVVARISPGDLTVAGPGHYTELVWEQKQVRAARDRGSIDWVIVRNRLSALESNNKKAIDRVMDDLADRYGFRCAAGFGERVIFRELYLKGLTLFDVDAQEGDHKRTMSHVAARHEIRNLMRAIGAPTGSPTRNHAAA